MSVSASGSVSSRDSSGSSRGGDLNVSSFDLSADAFGSLIVDLFKRKRAVLVSSSVLRKGDVEGVVGLPTPFGVVNFYFRARRKKRSSEADLSAVVLQAQLRRLPALFLTTGEVSKRGFERLSRDFPLLVFKLG